MIVTFVRHASTEWNASRRMQGRADVPLSPEGRRQAAAWRLPGCLWPVQWFASPLVRATATATIVGGVRPVVADALVEMDWGEWEGWTHADLLARHGAAFVENAARGLDFRPERGESPREVRMRLAEWIVSLAGSLDDLRAARSGVRPRDGPSGSLEYLRAARSGVRPRDGPSGSRGPVVAVTHKGVIRAALSLATGWDMTQKPPVRLRPGTAQVFRVAADGTLSLLAASVSLRHGGERCTR